MRIQLNCFIGVFIVSGICVAPVMAQAVEQPSARAPKDVLPADLVSAKNFEVKGTVRNEGFVNIYSVETPYGPFTVESTERLKVLKNEIQAIGVLEELEKSDEFTKAAASAGKGVWEGAKGLVTDPVDSLKAAGSGVSRMFKRMGESMRSEKSDAEDSTIKSMLGVSKVKRQYAQHLGVDPYSRNPALQKALDEVAWTAFSGGLGVKALTAMVPGAAGVVVGFSQTTNSLQQKIFTQDPNDLRMANRESLLDMGIDKDIANAFIDNGNFSPTDQTLLVGELASLTKAKGRQGFVAYAVSTPDPDVAYVRRRMAEMFSRENKKSAIVDLRVANGVPVAIDARGNALVCVPSDQILWTSALGKAAKDVTADIATWKGIKGRRLVLTGTLSPTARREFEALGWKADGSAGT